MAPNNFMPNNASLNMPYSGLMTPMMPQGMYWVKGKAEATNFPMARGTTLPIFDSEDDIFYVKNVDVYGNTQPLRVFRYEEITQADESSNKTEPVVSLEDYNSLKNEITDLKGDISELKKLLQSQNDYREVKKPYKKENRNNGQ